MNNDMTELLSKIDDFDKAAEYFRMFSAKRGGNIRKKTLLLSN